MPRTRRDRRQQARETTEPTAKLTGPDRRRVARVLAGITQAEANPTPDLATVHVQVPAQFPTPWTLPVALLAADAVLPDDLRPLLPPVDDNNDLLAREPAMGRRGYPWHRFNGWSWLVWSSFAEGEHVEIFTTVPVLRLERNVVAPERPDTVRVVHELR